MAVATTLTCRTSQPDTLTLAYKVALCVLAQGRTPAGAKSMLRCCWRSRRIWACFGAFARSWRVYMACARDKEGWGSAEGVW